MSRFFPSYNEKTLAAILATHGIKYKNLKAEFGARQKDARFFCEGYLDYAKFAESSEFKSGIKQVADLLADGETVCLMCAEKDPLNCHRAILCGKELKKVGFAVLHIVPIKDGVKTESHDELERRLLKLYFKQAEQYDLFGGDDAVQLTESYRRHNAKIGYRPES
jgi:uncharacterized protein (DUF488 family)